MAGAKLTDTEVQERVEKCFELRFRATHPITQKNWVDYCHHNYGDKSEQQYCSYWASAKNKYEETWKEKLNNLLSPAVEQLTRALASEDEKIRQRAIDQIMKYNGQDIQRVQAEITGDIKVTFGD